MTTREVDFTGPEEIVIAHLVWNLLFNYDRSYMVVTPTARLAQHWCMLVADAIARMPKYMNCGLKKTRDTLDFGNGNRVYFRTCTENAGRGMTISSLYVVEPGLIKDRVYKEFMYSVLPIVLSGRNRQVVSYSRGY
ncbi:hypothetical protein D3C75_778900 [compost metagenome]